MDRRKAESRLEDPVQFITHDLRSTTFHTTGLHDHGMLQRHWELLRQIQQRERNPEQKRLAAFELGTSKHIGQLAVLVQISAAQRIATCGDELFSHVHQ